MGTTIEIGWFSSDMLEVLYRRIFDKPNHAKYYLKRSSECYWWLDLNFLEKSRMYEDLRHIFVTTTFSTVLWNRCWKRVFFTCLWQSRVSNTARVRSIMDCNHLYAARRSFPPSFRKFSFFILTFQMGSTSLETLKCMQNAVFSDVRRVYLCW